MSNSVNAHPTKDFFIRMLTVDLDLCDAIVDLVDNSIDGARRVRTREDFQDFWIRLKVDPQEFRIEDNCGGMPLFVAQNYAFRFGRPPEYHGVEGSIGQFGVGMKRAFFKLGNSIRVASATSEDWFEMEIQVDEWKSKTNPEDWVFKFSKQGSAPHGREIGTIISVSDLHRGVASKFQLETWRKTLARDIEVKASSPMAEGLCIFLNDMPLHSHSVHMRYSANLTPATWETVLEGEDPSQSPVYVRLFAGLAESSPREAGWNVYCNSRPVLLADKTLTTGWGEEGEVTIPKAHNQFAQFRGYVFFDCADGRRLPMTTTKSGVDEESPVYQLVRQQMIAKMRPVIDFLNELDSEKEAEEQPRHEVLAAAKLEPLENVKVTVGSNFKFTPLPKKKRTPRRERLGNILFKRPLDEIEAVMQATGADNYSAAGQRAFDYYYHEFC